MNKILIKYSYSDETRVFINDEPVSPYSELTSLFKGVFWEYASKVFEALDNEIYDDYTVEICGNRIQFDLLKYLSKTSEYCKGIVFTNMDSGILPSEIEKTVKEICESYQIVQENNTSFEVCASSEEIKRHFEGLELKDVPQAEVGIFMDGEDVSENVKYPIIVANDFEVKRIGKRVIYVIPKSSLDDLRIQLEYEYVFLPRTFSLLTVLKHINMTGEHKARLDYYVYGKPSFIFENYKVSMNAGEEEQVKFISFPADEFCLKSDNSSVISVKDSRLLAIEGGNADIIVADKSGKEHKRIAITVFKHQYVESIKLIPRFDYLKRNERNVIDLVLIPQNAEDAGDVVWEVSDPNVLNVEKSGDVLALSEGVVRVCVKAKNVSQTIKVEVKPSLEKIFFPTRSICLESGEVYVIECHKYPENAPLDSLQWEFDNKNIASINPSKTGERCQIVASSTYVGKGNVRCYDAETKIGAICNLEVVAKKKAKKTVYSIISCLCFIFGIFFPYLLPVSIIASILGLEKDKEERNHRGYIWRLVLSIIVLLLWIIPWINS